MKISLPALLLFGFASQVTSQACRGISYEQCAESAECLWRQGSCVTAGANGGGQANPPESTEPFKFCVVADTPYSAAEACMLKYTIGTKPNEYSLGLKEGDCELLIHLGDIRDGQPYNGECQCELASPPRPCPESLYSEVLTNIFKDAPMPTFFIPGDNGWLDCEHADEAYGFWQTHLFPFNDLHWGHTDFATVPDGPGSEPESSNYIVERSSIPRGVDGYDRKELFSIYVKDRQILLLGMSLPGGGKSGYENTPNGRVALIHDNNRWLETQLAVYSAEPYGIRGAVVFGHGYNHLDNSAFAVNFMGLSAKYSHVPLLFVSDNRHNFVTPDVPFGNGGNTWNLDVDDTVTPVIVTFEPELFHTDGSMPIRSYDRGCDCSTDHRPTKILESTDPCYAYCEQIYALCPMCSSASGDCGEEGTFSQSQDGVLVFPGPEESRLYDVCTGDGIGCFLGRHHKSLSKTKTAEKTYQDGELTANLSRYH